ncbi:MAG: GTPase HflX [Eubacteriales bacterium]
MIHGNIKGIKKTILDELDNLIDYNIEKGKLIDHDVTDKLLQITEKINKEILVIIDNSNKIISVSIGDNKTTDIHTMDLKIRKRGLNGLNCLHTHPNLDPRLSPADFSSLELLRFNVLGAIGKNMKTNKPIVNIGLLVFDKNKLKTEEYGPFTINMLNDFKYDHINNETNKYLISRTTEEIEEDERAVLVGLNTDGDHVLDIEDSIEELRELCKTAGAVPVGIIIQNKERADNTTYLGKGKLDELRLLIQNAKANLIICNDELTSIQIKVIEASLGVKVIDRTALILDIFARHAKTSEGKLQVELAQLKYRLPRLQGLGKVLSRTGGGIGTRGPGEKKLEIDRRTIYREINILENKIKNINKIRQQQKNQRQKNSIPQVALVGYTNAGKSTLFNVLTNSQVLSENKLFATLDSTIRKIKNIDRDILLSDTVGFIDKLPHDLVKAFESTLEDVSDADLLLHVIDASNAKFLEQVQLVNEVLKSIGSRNINTVLVFNKIDKKCNGFEIQYSALRDKKVMISAKYTEGIDELLSMILNEIYGRAEMVELHIPYDDMKFVAHLHELGIVQDDIYLDEYIKLKVMYREDIAHIVKKYNSGEKIGLFNNQRT